MTSDNRMDDSRVAHTLPTYYDLRIRHHPFI